jgi:hypothetical protein
MVRDGSVPTEVGGDVVLGARVLGNGEAGGGGEPVVGVEGRCMAAVAAFAGEEFFTADCAVVELVGIGWGLEGIDIEGEGVELLVAVAAADFDGVRRVGELLEFRDIGGDEAVEAGEHVTTLIERSVAHHIDE